MNWRSIVRGKIDRVSNVARSNVRRPNVPRSNGGDQMSWTPWQRTKNVWIGRRYPVMLSPRGQAVLESRPKFCPRPRRFVIGLGLCLEHLSSACPRTFYFGLVKMCLMLELVILTHNYQFHYVFKFAFMVVFNYYRTAAASQRSSATYFIHCRITATPQIPDCHQ